MTPYGGLALAVDFCRRFKVPQCIDKHVKVLKVHLPYHESDHVLALAFNLFVGGTCIEDQANLQHSEAVRRMVGACRIPDPTTAGDFLRRFDEQGDYSLAGLRRANDEVQTAVGMALAEREGKRKRKDKWAVVDVDGHVKALSGEQKEGADFFKRTWCYMPLLVSLAGTGESAWRCATGRAVFAALMAPPRCWSMCFPGSSITSAGYWSGATVTLTAGTSGRRW